MSTVRFDQVTKRFGKTTAVDAMSLDIVEGEFMVLLGPSGCGKSTALRMIAGLESITEGALSIDGEVVNHVDPRKRGIAMVFQSYALYPNLTVRKNIESPLKAKDVPPDGGGDPRRLSSEERDARVIEAARMLDLEDYLDRKPGALSGGQRQRVALARAIVARAKVLLMDEPLSNLDAKLRAQTRAELIDLHERLGGTVVYVTHDQIEAMTMADRVAIMANGALHQVGTPDDVYDRPANTFVAGFIGTPPMNLMDGVATSDGVEVAGAKLDATHQLAVGAPVVVGIRPEHLVLSDDGLAMEVKAVEWLGYESLITADLVDVGAAQRSARDAADDGDSNDAGTTSLVGDAVVDANDPEQVGATRRRVILRANGRVDARNGKIIRATPQAGAVQLFDADTGVHL
ncbi:MAG: ABC transporter ATP-binding protein [Candidatus Microthrix sp.]|nr:ABC transporter ATP-binding protein [Candidatus Microthrix sp.]MBK6438592.1 ABC transporter ATP-binding protein [Candidatus Microthrix sp.]